MFWKIIRWGCTLLIVAITVGAIVAGSDSKPAAAPAPADTGKNFNGL